MNSSQHPIEAPGKPRSSGWALVVDDHPLFCDALELTLRAIGSYQNVTTANCLENALDIVAKNKAPELVLLDLNLPDVTGLDGLIRLKSQISGTPIVVVSSMTDNSIVGAAIQAGASGFVPKHSRQSVFRDAIETISIGKIYKPAGYVEGVPTEQKNDASARLATLTNQQARILQQICEGKLNKQIAYELSIAETTVKAHVTAIMRKLGVQSRTQAVLVAQDTKFSKVLSTRE